MPKYHFQAMPGPQMAAQPFVIEADSAKIDSGALTFWDLDQCIAAWAPGTWLTCIAEDADVKIVKQEAPRLEIVEGGLVQPGGHS